jgi:hypothetical protein
MSEFSTQKKRETVSSFDIPMLFSKPFSKGRGDEQYVRQTRFGNDNVYFIWYNEVTVEVENSPEFEVTVPASIVESASRNDHRKHERKYEVNS